MQPDLKVLPPCLTNFGHLPFQYSSLPPKPLGHRIKVARLHLRWLLVERS